jgi:V8-like Glu-specific endopeptidase
MSLVPIQIVKGNVTTGIERWPWLVYFLARRNSINRLPCSATLIAPRWVLTAAHCTRYAVDEEKALNASYVGRNTKGLVLVNIGEWGKRTASFKKIWRIHQHPDYQLIDLGKGEDTGTVTIHDLALLEVSLQG